MSHAPPNFLQAAGYATSYLTSPYPEEFNQLSPGSSTNHRNHGSVPMLSDRGDTNKFQQSRSIQEYHHERQQQQQIMASEGANRAPPSAHSSHQSQSQNQQYSQRSSYTSSSAPGFGASQILLDEQRKQEILQRLQAEREERRRMIQENQGINQGYNPSSNMLGNNGAQIGQSGYGGATLANGSQHSRSYAISSLKEELIEDQQPLYSHRMQNSNSNMMGLDGQSVTSSQNQPLTQSKKELVARLLNERRLGRSGGGGGGVSQHEMSAQSHKSSHQNYYQEQIPTQLQYSAARNSQMNAVAEDNTFGGYNPEALYQDDVLQEQHQRDFEEEDSKYQAQEDVKYKEAVEYARAQIERDRQKRLQELNEQKQRMIEGQQIRNNNFMREASNHFHSASQDSNSNSMSKRGVTTNNRSQSREDSIENTTHQNPYQQLPPSVYNIERQLAQHSADKQLNEMNRRPTKLKGSSKHQFTYESEDDQKQQQQRKGSRNRDKRVLASNSEERGFRKTMNQMTRTLSSGKVTIGDYMKPTVNADLKKQAQGQEGPVPTIAKSKQILTEAEKKFKEEHTFKPSIKDYPLPQSKEVSKEERWKKLTEPKTVELQKRERIRAQIEIEETQKTCPFKPNLGPTSTKSGRTSSTGRKSGAYDSLTLPERLLHEADFRKEKREKLKREIELEQMKDCSFKPKILSSMTIGSNSNNQSTSYATLAVVNLDKLKDREPIHNRVGELQKQKNEKLQKLRMDNEKDQQSEYTFQPHLNKKSAKIAVIKQSQDQNNSVVERLYKDANDRIDKQMSHNVSVNEQMNREYSFHPQISKSSAYLSVQSDFFNGNMKDFYERQEAFLKRQQEKKMEARKKWADEERFSYKPEINATSEVIVESDPNRGGETENDRIMRLYQKDQKRQEVVRDILEKEIYQQYTFKPEINKVSKAIARNSTSIDELAYNPKGKEKKEQLQEEMLTQEFSNCTFRPQTTKSRKYQNVSSTYSISDCATTEEYSKKLKEKLKEKQERIAQERREREYQQLKDCTFHPKILDKDPPTAASNESIEVKGLARHLELKELKKKQDEERRLREAEVFGLNHKFAVKADDLDISKLPPGKQPGAKIQAPHTVPQPFELTNAGRLDERKKAMLMKELKEREMTECTFKPSTNEGRNKKIINDLLQNMDNDSLGMRRSYLFNATQGERAASNDDKENYQQYYNYPQQMTQASGNGNQY